MTVPGAPTREVARNPRPDVDYPPTDPRHPHYNPDPHAHPGLHAIALVEGAKGLLAVLAAIALVEGAKGLLAVLAASGLELLGPAPLRRWVRALIGRFHLDPRDGTLALFARQISPDAVHLAAAAILAYGLLHLLEAWGLWHARAWASWLGCIAASLYLPLDLYALWGHPGWPALAVLTVNLLVVWVLARDLLRRRY